MRAQKPAEVPKALSQELGSAVSENVLWMLKPVSCDRHEFTYSVNDRAFTSSLSPTLSPLMLEATWVAM